MLKKNGPKFMKSHGHSEMSFTLRFLQNEVFMLAG